MTIQIIVPTLGESVTEATVARWLKAKGDVVEQDEALVELETDKVTLEVNAPQAGTLTDIATPEGANVNVGALLGVITENGMGTSAPEAVTNTGGNLTQQQIIKKSVGNGHHETEPTLSQGKDPGPAVRKAIAESHLDVAALAGSGKGGRITKSDIAGAMTSGHGAELTKAALKPPAPSALRQPVEAREERVRMSRLRKRIAERLKEAQNNAAMLTTFNEVDMTAVMAARARYNPGFEKKHGVKLGFMSFFVKACIAALHEIPAVNASIDGDEIVYKNYYDIGVAVGTEQGLVVPIVRDADYLSFAEIEKTIADLGIRARSGKLQLDELTGGTFTISNGGVYGSLNSTPILNPPQSGILGMHKIEKRPRVITENGVDTIAIRPMMYLAMSYDHRIVDGREAVTFLIHVKDAIEDPQRLLFDF